MVGVMPHAVDPNNARRLRELSQQLIGARDWPAGIRMV
jgi:hypothetical protein